jgi:thiol:disulfide interchange protein
METFRRVLAVPMGLVALALVWLAGQLGGDLFMFSMAALVGVILVGLTLIGRGQRSGQPLLVPTLVFAAVVPAFAVYGFVRAYDGSAAAKDESLLAAVPFSETALAEARAANRPVFLWFTADWCLTCKVNEGVAIEREATRDAFAKAGVVAMRGDWTRRDPAITRFLTAHGAAGVPLYLWYAPGKDGEVLPQVLTPDMLSERAAGG